MHADLTQAAPSASETTVIGWSTEGRPLAVSWFGDPRTPLRVFILAGQHGDERYARKALRRLMKDLEERSDPHWSSIRLAILDDANPDGSLRKTRENAQGIDLNRDHIRLESPETRAVHGFVACWRPHLVIDVHNYPSRRRRFLSEDLVLDSDVFLDVPTNAALPVLLGQEQLQELLDCVRAELASHGYTFERYILVSAKGRARHSTPDVVDLRNSLALRYGAFTVLLEGRQPTRDDGKPKRQRLVAATRLALGAVLRWASSKPELLAPRTPVERQVVTVRGKYQRAMFPALLPVRHVATGEARLVPIDRYTPDLRPVEWVALPQAYAVPDDRRNVLHALDRHGFQSCSPVDSAPHAVEASFIRRAVRSRKQNRPPRRVVVETVREKRTLDGYVLFPAGADGALFLAVLLEPGSKYGLHRYPDMELTVQEGTMYPVLRVLE